MRIGEDIEMLEVRSEVMGKPTVIHPVLIREGDSAILVDTGYPGSLPELVREVERFVPFDRVDTIILTHQDIDHIGNLATIVKAAAPRKVRVLCHEEEKPYVEGRQEPHKLKSLEERAKNAPPETQVFLRKLLSGFQASYSAVDRTLTDGEELPFGGGMRIIHSPGHTVGHICLYFARDRLLVAGDVFWCAEGVPERAPSSSHLDLERYEDTLVKLSRLDIESVVCYHGGLCASGAGERIRELASA